MTPGSTIIIKRPVTTSVGRLTEKLKACKFDVNTMVLEETGQGSSGGKKRYLVLASLPELMHSMRTIAPTLAPWIVPFQITLEEGYPGETVIATLNSTALICKYYEEPLLLPAAEQLNTRVEECLEALHKEDPIVIERVTSW
jgi:hypothetical protein